MGTKVGFALIVIGVVCMMFGMINLVVKFQEESEIKKVTHEATLDSLTAIKFNEILYNDSIMVNKIESQQQEIETLKSQLSNIKYKLSVLADINSNQ